MKARKLVFSLLTMIAIGGATMSILSSCGGIDQDILDNQVSTGDNSVLAKWKDSSGNDQSITLDQEIKTALTDQKSNQAFKSAVVDKILWHWISNLSSDGASGTNIKDRIKQWNKDIDKDYDKAVQASKDKYYSNWKFYFQNEELNQYGGTKEDWKNHERYQKARQYFISGGIDSDSTGHIVSKSYLAVPKIIGSDVSIYDNPIIGGLSGINPSQYGWIGHYCNNLEADVVTTIGTNDNYGLGSDALFGGTSPTSNVLNPDWWPTINFYAKANKDFRHHDDPKDGDQDPSYAFIQGVAFDDYIKHVRPYSTSSLSWNYEAPTDLKEIYNNGRIKDAGGDSSLLSKPSFAFPYFQDPNDQTIGANRLFRNFVDAFNATNNYFLSDRGSGLNLGLINFPKTRIHMGATALSLIDETTTGADATPYETYVAPIFSTLNDYKNNGAGVPTSMATCADSGGSSNFFQTNSGETLPILSNFLFVNASSTNTLTDLNKLPSAYSSPNVSLDLASIYEQGTNAAPDTKDHLLIFNPYYRDTLTPWYDEGARYLIDAIRLVSSSITGRQNLPYIMIRTANGVSVEGIDGIDYLAATSEEAPIAANSKWVPGDKYSVERAAQIIKYRTAYENFSDDKQVNGFSIIKNDSNGTSGALKTYMDAHMDDIILNAVAKVMRTPRENYYDKGILGLNFGSDAIPYGMSGNNQWNEKLMKLFDAFDKLNVFQSTLTNFDAANKKLLAWGDAYQTNSLVNVATGSPDEKSSEQYTYYKNGLAQSLPLRINIATMDASNMFTYKISYDASYFATWDTMEDFSLIDSVSNEPKSLTTLVNATVSAYNDWIDSLVTTSDDCYQKPTKNGKGTSYGKYSENILTYNYYINALLWSFGGGNAFSASIKTWALDNYIGDFFGSLGALDLNTYEDAFVSLYATSNLITNDNVTQIFNSNNDGRQMTYNRYKSTLGFLTQEDLLATIGSTTIMDGANVNSFGYSDALIKFKQIQATIKWLTDSNYKNFIAWLQNSIGIGKNDFQNTDAGLNPSYIAWASKENIKFHNSDFSNAGANPDKVYGWKSNYNGIFNNVYNNTNLPTPSDNFGNKTYTSFKKYWQFAPMPGQANEMMGYLGLLNMNSAGWSDVSANVKTAIGSFKNYCSKEDHDKYTGTLYSLNSGSSDPAQIRMDIISRLSQGSPDEGRIMKYATFIDQQTGLLTANGVIDSLNDAVGGAAKLQILTDAIADANIIPNQCFVGYNNVNTNTKTYELNYGGDPVIMDTDDQNNGIGSRVTIMQISPADVATKDVDGNPNDIMGRLAAICGGTAPNDGKANGLVSYLIMQAALDSTQQNLALNDVIKTQFHNGKVVVFDRRFNDQLGSDWVKGWKKKN